MKTSNLISILLGTVILMSVSIYNGYPLVYWDSGTYIHSGFSLFVPKDRPIAYGLFIKLFSLNKSLWFIVIIQNLLMCSIVFDLFKLLFGSKKIRLFFLTTISFLTFFTGIAWYSNQIMPDFLSAIMVLILYLLLYSERLGKVRLMMYSLILIFTLVTHFSHLIIASGILILIACYEYIAQRKSKQIDREFNFKRLLLCGMIIIASGIILPVINYCVDQKFLVSRGSHAFLMGHFVDNGVLKKFLKENCNKEEYKDCKMCFYKDSLPTDLSVFLWEPGGVFQKTGGWDNSEAEYNKIFKGIFKNPKYWISNINKTVLYAGIQLTRNEIGQGLIKYDRSSAPYAQVYWRFNDELNYFLNSKQNSVGLEKIFQPLNRINFFITVFSFFFFLIFLFGGIIRKLNAKSVAFLVFTIGAVIVNATVTAGLNAPCDRFQARVSWLLTLAIVLVIITNRRFFRTALRNLFTESVEETL